MAANWRHDYADWVEDQIDALGDQSLKSAALAAIEKIVRNPTGGEKLKTKEGNLYKVCFRKDYRVVYRRDDKDRLISIRAVGHRREIYRWLGI